MIFDDPTVQDLAEFQLPPVEQTSLVHIHGRVNAQTGNLLNFLAVAVTVARQL